MQKLILYLEKSDLTELSWVITNEQGAPEQIVLHSQLSELDQHIANKTLEVIAVAPPEDVLILSAKMPKLNRQRLLQALPFAVEEQLLAEVDELHFALGDYLPEGLPVAVVNKEKLRYWLHILKEHNLQPSAIIPAPLAIPRADHEWTVKVFAESAIIRTGVFSGYACDKHNLTVLLQLKSVEQAQPPAAINITNYTTFALPQATVQAPEQDFMLELVNLDSKTTLNLLQGAFQPKRPATNTKKIWLMIATLAGACFAVALACDLISLMVLMHQQNKLETAISTIYKHNFPAATSVVSPKARMTEKLNNLTNENHKNRLLAWLAYLAKSGAQYKTINYKQFDFRNNQLSLEFSAPDLASLDGLTQSLTQQGLRVKQQNVIAAGKGATGTLLISDGETS